MPVLNFRISAADADLLRQAAAQDGRTLSDYLRHTVGLSVRRKRRHPQAAEMGPVLAELGRIGGNINQLAKWSNGNRQSPNMLLLQRAAADVRRAREAIEAQLK